MQLKLGDLGDLVKDVDKIYLPKGKLHHSYNVDDVTGQPFIWVTGNKEDIDDDRVMNHFVNKTLGLSNYSYELNSRRVHVNGMISMRYNF